METDGKSGVMAMTPEEKEARQLAREAKNQEKEEKRRQKELQEQKRLEEMLTYERQYGEMCQFICGIDEAGRGPLAGPVVAAAVILPRGLTIPYVNDSKKLSEKRRELLYPEIMEKALAVGVGIVSPERIDEINILQATFEAMRQAVSKLSVSPDFVMVDGNKRIPDLEIPQMALVKGDGKSMSIACASIVAKVTRDHMMTEYDKMYPEYGFASHKGYGSASHIQAIQEFGPSPIHRRSFITHIICKSGSRGEEYRGEDHGGRQHRI
jgi:ribonuclease HII